MVEKHFRKIIEQCYRETGTENNKIVLVKYSNTFSIEDLKKTEEIKNSSVECMLYEFSKSNLADAYEPFLDLIFNLFRKYEHITFEQFMDECQVYSLHKAVFRSYFQNGTAERREELLYNEVEYEKKKMEHAVIQMLLRVSRIQPFLLVINRLSLASKTSLNILLRLVQMTDQQNIGIVLGLDESQKITAYKSEIMELLIEKLEDRSSVYSIGTVKEVENPQKNYKWQEFEEKKIIQRINNVINFLDFEHALYYLDIVNQKLRFENYSLDENLKMEVWHSHAKAAIYTDDMARALEISESMRELAWKNKNAKWLFSAVYLKAVVYMFQGKLSEAALLAEKASAYAEKAGDELLKFKADLLQIQSKMSGWNNIFFCTRDIDISEQMLKDLEKYEYYNYLAYIYIYAYDNQPEILDRSYQSGTQLVYFSKGMELADKIGNEQLIYTAYQKNIMIAAANGMYDIAILYYLRTYDTLKNKKSVECGRLYSGIAYNLSALGKHDMVRTFFKKAVEQFYELNLCEDIAEVYYNMALEEISVENYKEAGDCILKSLKIVDKLLLNSLRVCNFSKLYALLALCYVKTDNLYSAEQYLEKCRLFLNYVFEKEQKTKNVDQVHDFAMCDDDAFLYYFALALKQLAEQNGEMALENLSLAEKYLMRAEGNEFFCYHLYRKTRIELFEKIGRTDFAEREKEAIKLYDLKMKSHRCDLEKEMLRKLKQMFGQCPVRDISAAEIEQLIITESRKREFIREKRQLKYISTWQNLVNAKYASKEEMLENAMQSFLYHFSLDKAIYIQYHEEPEVLYNDTELYFLNETLLLLKSVFEKEGKGFVVSKVSRNYENHKNIIGLFGEDNVCSMLAIPFYDNRKVTSIFITYILMKDNWHSSVNRYMLNDNDRSMCELLFWQVHYAIKQMEANEKIYEMNERLFISAITDQLTGLINRKGFYQKLDDIVERIGHGTMQGKLSIMFIDLDNFKGYNDTFGHDVGDLLLKETGKIFQSVCENTGFATRYGGDEFIITLFTDEKTVLEETASRVYHEIRKQDGFIRQISEIMREEILIPDEKKISCSIGIAFSSKVKTIEDINALIKSADDLLYIVKKQTKGTFLME